MKHILLAFALLMVVGVTFASDVTGRWAGRVGEDMEIALDLKVDGKKLIGTITTTQGAFAIQDGGISGNSFRFSFVRDGMTASVKGSVNGERLDLTLVADGKERKGSLRKLNANEEPWVTRQKQATMSEHWSPAPKVVDPGPYLGPVAPPADAIVLFDGKDLSKWKSRDGSDAKWKVADGVFTVEKGTGDITTRQKFGDYQLHLEWRIPADIQGESQSRGNSGVFLQDMSDDLKIPEYWYEIQILDNYNNKTYVNGQAASVYKQSPPLVNAMRKPGEWNVYDIFYTAPRFNEDGSLFARARVTVVHNGILVQDNFQILGHTAYIGHPKYYAAHGKAPISLQDHGDPSKAISFRNIWLRER